MYGMFAGCSSLTNLDLSSFDTSKVTDMSYIFLGCSSLKSLDISSFDLASASYCFDIFENCSSLETIVTPTNLNHWTINLPYQFKYNYRGSGEALTTNVLVENETLTADKQNSNLILYIIIGAVVVAVLVGVIVIVALKKRNKMRKY